MKIRMVRTTSGSLAVQVVRYADGKTKVLKHLGSAKTKERTADLKRLGSEWIREFSRQESLFPESKEEHDLLREKYLYLGFRYGLIYEAINKIMEGFGLDENIFPQKGKIKEIFFDLVLARIVEPASKRASQRILSSLFGIDYQLTSIYRFLKILPPFKEEIEKRLIIFAKKNLGFDFSFVLYDITTLYFETFTEDDIRKCGFSKDNKIGQPQILIGLVVDRTGFPLSFAVFEGNKFEGSTLIPVILKFKETHQIANLAVVADAAMISEKNIISLKQAGLNYIVGARLGNIKPQAIKEISERLNRLDGTSLKVKTSKGYLICSFSAKRYAKDKHEMEKRLKKAQQILEGKGEARRNKFLSKDKNVAYFLNKAVIDKTELLLGIKGYYTNLDLPEKTVIERYQDLWRIEKSFRISKNDLEARPVYHFKKQAIIAHILICVTALAVLKWIEISTQKSARYVVNQLKEVSDGRVLNLVTNKEVLMRSKISDEVLFLLKKLSPH